MTEIHFVIEEAQEGGYIARAMGFEIFTEADDIPTLHEQVRDVVPYKPKILFLNRQDAMNAKKNMRLENMICSPFRLAQYRFQHDDSLGDLGVLGG